MQPEKSQPYTIPAPVGGWNARDPFPMMDSRDALTLDNVFPEANLCRVIGAGLMVDSYAVTNGAIQTFTPYFPSTGNAYAIAGDGTNFRVVTSGGAFTGSPYAHGGPARWEAVNFNGSIVLVSGSSAPVAYNGTTWSNPVYTGTYSGGGALNANALSHVDTFKSRLYFTEGSSLNIWFGGIRAISGALTQYDISGIVRRGGSIVFAGSITRDIKAGLNDIFIIVTDQGEVLFFSGDSPDASNWSIAGRAYIGTPMGKRAFCTFRSDLLIATTEGIVSASTLLQQGEATRYLTEKIQNAYNAAATAAASFDGWELRYWPSGHMLLLNVPQSYPTDVHQYVMNVYTGAWCRFKGIQASALCPIGNKLFYATRAASNNQIIEFGKGSTPPADIEIQSAFLPLGQSDEIKQVKRIRPFWNGTRGFQYYLECPTDFDSPPYNNMVRAFNNVATPWGSAWGSPWSSGVQTNTAYFSVDCRMGTFFGYRIKTNQASGINFVAPAGTTLSAVSFIFESGGII